MANNKKNNNKANGLKTANNKMNFLAFYKTMGTVGQACEKVGIKSRKTIYNWIEKDKEFAEVYEELKANRTDELTSTLYRSGVGELALTSAQVTSAIFLLKSFDP
ncbi:unnamed protein product, partial [marine sediment metagenome]